MVTQIYRKCLSMVLVAVVTIAALGLISPQQVEVFASETDTIGAREATRRIPVFNNRNLNAGQNDRNIVGYLEVGDRIYVWRAHGLRTVSISSDAFPTNLRQEPTRYIDRTYLQTYRASERVLDEGTRIRYVARGAGVVTTTIRDNPRSHAGSVGSLRTGDRLYVNRLVTMSDGSQWAHIQVQNNIRNIRSGYIQTTYLVSAPPS